MNRILPYLVFSFVGGLTATGATTFYTSIAGPGMFNMIYGGMLATFLGYTIENWFNKGDFE